MNQEITTKFLKLEAKLRSIFYLVEQLKKLNVKYSKPHTPRSLEESSTKPSNEVFKVI